MHSKEVGFLAGMMAEELDMDVALARRAGLLHDVAKALAHDVGSDPVQASAALARKSGESNEVVEVIETHKQNQPGRSAVAILVESANEISIHRPGALKEKVDDYIKRMRHIEETAMGHPGVDHAFALQNGKEVRVLVDSLTVDDAYAWLDAVAEKLQRDGAPSDYLELYVVDEQRQPVARPGAQ